jgi:RNA polymerase sigma-70 factor (ECF subfamily)
MEDEAIIALYWRRMEEAITQTDLKYGGCCHAVANHILSSDEDAEECVNDTWLRAWNAIPPQRPTRLGAFLVKITRNLAFDRYRAKTAEKRGSGRLEGVLEELEECVSGTHDVPGEAEAKELAAAIRRFLTTLPEEERSLFLRRYFFGEETAAMARRYGLQSSHVQVRLSRTRKKLRAFLHKEGYL